MTTKRAPPPGCPWTPRNDERTFTNGEFSMWVSRKKKQPADSIKTTSRTDSRLDAAVCGPIQPETQFRPDAAIHRTRADSPACAVPFIVGPELDPAADGDSTESSLRSPLPHKSVSSTGLPAGTLHGLKDCRLVSAAVYYPGSTTSDIAWLFNEVDSDHDPA